VMLLLLGAAPLGFLVADALARAHHLAIK